MIRVLFILGDGGWGVQILDKDRFLVGPWGKLGHSMFHVLGELVLILYKLMTPTTSFEDIMLMLLPSSNAYHFLILFFALIFAYITFFCPL